MKFLNSFVVFSFIVFIFVNIYCSLPFTAQNSANADFANFDAFGQSSGSSNFGGFPTASHSPFQPQTTGRASPALCLNVYFKNKRKVSRRIFEKLL